MREIMRLVNDRGSRLYGYRVMWTILPEYPHVIYHIDRDRRVVYINKSSHAGANVVSLS